MIYDGYVLAYKNKTRYYRDVELMKLSLLESDENIEQLRRQSHNSIKSFNHYVTALLRAGRLKLTPARKTQISKMRANVIERLNRVRDEEAHDECGFCQGRLNQHRDTPFWGPMDIPFCRESCRHAFSIEFHD